METLNLRKRMNRRSFLRLTGLAGLTLMSASALGACSSGGSGTGSPDASGGSEASTGGTHTVTDMQGVSVTLPDNLDKYVEDWFAHNEFDIMLDKGKGMVMTNCSADDFPWMYKVCPAMHNAKYFSGETPDFDEVVSLGAQALFSQVEDLRSKCEEIKVPMVDVMFHTFEEMQKSVTLTAEVFNTDDAKSAAESYNSDLSGVLSDLKAKIDTLSDDQKPKVLTGSSVYTYDLDGTGTIIQAWIEACGGKQVVTGKTTGSTQSEYSLEQIIAWDPDIIITDDPGQPEQIMGDSEWASITAVKNKAVYVNPSGAFYWNRYGIEELLQLKWASKLFHPDLFGDVDINAAVKDFYSKYLYYDLTDQDVEYILAAKTPDGDVSASLKKAE